MEARQQTATDAGWVTRSYPAVFDRWDELKRKPAAWWAAVIIYGQFGGDSRALAQVTHNQFFRLLPVADESGSRRAFRSLEDLGLVYSPRVTCSARGCRSVTSYRLLDPDDAFHRRGLAIAEADDQLLLAFAAAELEAVEVGDGVVLLKLRTSDPASTPDAESFDPASTPDAESFDPASTPDSNAASEPERIESGVYAGFDPASTPDAEIPFVGTCRGADRGENDASIVPAASKFSAAATDGRQSQTTRRQGIAATSAASREVEFASGSTAATGLGSGPEAAHFDPVGKHPTSDTKNPRTKNFILPTPKPKKPSPRARARLGSTSALGADRGESAAELARALDQRREAAGAAEPETPRLGDAIASLAESLDPYANEQRRRAHEQSWFERITRAVRRAEGLVGTAGDAVLKDPDARSLSRYVIGRLVDDCEFADRVDGILDDCLAKAEQRGRRTPLTTSPAAYVVGRFRKNLGYRPRRKPR